MTIRHWSEYQEGERWPREVCELRYVTGSQISLQQLAKDASYSASTVQNWCREEKWVKKRADHIEQMKAEGYLKVAQEASDEFADAATEAIKGHRSGLATQRKIAIAFMNSLAYLIAADSNPEQVSPKKVARADRVVNRISALTGRNPLGVCSQILAATVSLETAVYNLDLCDPKKLEKEAKKFNLLLIDAKEIEELELI